MIRVFGEQESGALWRLGDGFCVLVLSVVGGEDA